MYLSRKQRPLKPQRDFFKIHQTYQPSAKNQQFHLLGQVTTMEIKPIHPPTSRILKKAIPVSKESDPA